ncbi:hypothetical protein HNO88_000507 [Novosphingobium chloroacetimidivorans]|uniref:Uncharacterized protein n=1 Tax=Novosphingobium chloroacetimidivorans TaxID=1428314 RepID=A0A7W7K6L4_9SPHN|nr:hypothetical protein [Novosphingobium chloroacetimidivorans]MBB4857200.1 hypothetical protein [Novosphingobium chloroacetimidivorans]
MILALRGAKSRAEGEFRRQMTAAWLCGLLGQVDPRAYPKLEEIVADAEKPKAAPISSDPAEASANLKAWGAWLKAVNRRA